MSKDQEKIEELKAKLREQLKKVPAWVSGASIQATRDWKGRHAVATKVLSKKNVTAAQLMSAISMVQ